MRAGALDPSELHLEHISLPTIIQPEAEAAQPRCWSGSGMMLRAVQQMRIRVRTGMKKIIPEVSTRGTMDSLSSTEVLYPAPVM